MLISKGKERAPSLTGNIIIAIIVTVVQQKDIYSRITEPDTFSGDRKKFKAYET
jgi:hypothetical protein